MDVVDAIRKRRAVRRYTDRPIPEGVLDRILRMALAAPTGSGAQAWGLTVVREPELRRQIAELVIAGGGRYFAIMRPRAEGATDEEHVAWGREYAEQILGSYRQVPVWVLGTLVPRDNYPASMREGGHLDDVISVAFAMENLFLVARAEGIGSVPTTAFQRFEKDRLREILGMPPEVDPVILTPLGYPEAFPEGRPPALKRTFRRWQTLVHDERWGNTRAPTG
ncbi:MAG: nitroreductase family protein [Actinobacteria bacterium]|nr:nitroreductase family protein [Actinomycetota bacterium]